MVGYPKSSFFCGKRQPDQQKRSLREKPTHYNIASTRNRVQQAGTNKQCPAPRQKRTRGSESPMMGARTDHWTTPRRRKFTLYDTPRAYIDKVPNILDVRTASASIVGRGGGEIIPSQVLGESGEVVNPPTSISNMEKDERHQEVVPQVRGSGKGSRGRGGGRGARRYMVAASGGYDDY